MVTAHACGRAAGKSAGGRADLPGDSPRALMRWSCLPVSDWEARSLPTGNPAATQSAGNRAD